MATAAPVSIDDMWRRLECPVCHDHYRSPKMLPCGHTLCLSPCLEQIQNGKPRINCPECRMEHVVPETGFPPNIAISRMTEDATDKKDQTFKGCPICGEDDHLIQCFHCSLLICEECKIQHTPKFRKQLCSLVETFKEEISHTRNECSNFELKLREQVKAEADLSRGEIDAVSKRLYSALENRIQKMKDTVDAFENAENEVISEQQMEIDASLHQSSKFCESVLEELNSESRLSHAKLAKIKTTYEERFTKISRSKIIINKPKKVCKLDFDIGNIEEAIRSCDVESIIDKSVNTSMNMDTDGSSTDNKVPTLNIVEKFSSSNFLHQSQVKNCIGSSNLKFPFGIAFDLSGQYMFVVDNNKDRICVFWKNGNMKDSFGSHGSGDRQFVLPVGIAVSKKGFVFISDQSNDRIQVFDTSGTFIRKFGGRGTKSGMFRSPLGIALDQQGDVHVCDSQNKRVQVFDEDGHFNYDYNTWINSSDEIVKYISISESGLIAIKLKQHIVVLNQSRRLLSHFKFGLGLDNGMGGIQFIHNSHLLLCDVAQENLRLCNVNGDILKEIEIKLPGGLDKPLRPTCIALNGEDIYISCSSNNVIFRI